MSTVVGKDLCSYQDQICGGRTKSASVICPPGPNLLALLVPPDQIRGWTDFTVTPAVFGKGLITRDVLLYNLVLSFGKSILRTFGKSILRTFGQSILRTFRKSILRAFGQSILRTFGKSILRTFGKSILRTFGKSILRTFGKSIFENVFKIEVRL